MRYIGLLALAAAVAGTAAYGQLPPGLMKPATQGGKVHSEAFYKGKEGFWVLMRNPQNDGLNCSVNFINNGGVFALHGPKDAAMAKKKMAMIWFSSKDVPKPASPQQANITVHSADPVQTWPVVNARMDDELGAFMAMTRVSDFAQQKHDSDEMVVEYEGKEVFRSKVIRIHEAIGVLNRCMSAQKS